MVWYYIGVSIINRTLHDHLEIQNFSSCVKKYFIILFASLTHEIFHTQREIADLHMAMAILEILYIITKNNNEKYELHLWISSSIFIIWEVYITTITTTVYSIYK